MITSDLLYFLSNFQTVLLESYAKEMGNRRIEISIPFAGFMNLKALSRHLYIKFSLTNAIHYSI